MPFRPIQTLSRLTALGAIGVGVYAFVVRPWHQRWGAADDEVDRVLPGDDLIPDAMLRATHAITIAAPPAAVWPWLVQIGQGRGGFYTHDWIENLMGLNIHSADTILPEHQTLAVGDEIPLAPPPNALGLPVAILETEHALVLHGDTRTNPPAGITLRPGDFIHAVWGFYLFPLENGHTRLVERWQASWKADLTNFLFYRAFLEPGAFIMESGMLLGIKRRVEAHAQPVLA